MINNLLSIPEAAREIGFSAKTMRKMCKNQEIAHYVVGGRYRIKAEDLCQYLEAQRVERFEA